MSKSTPPPPFENWSEELLSELNKTVDVHALSRDVPRLKISSPRRLTVSNKFVKPPQQQHDDKADDAETDRADMMVRALLHLEELCGGSHVSGNNNNSNAADSPPLPKREPRSNNNAPNDDDDDDHAQQQPHVITSPLRKNAVDLYPQMDGVADLSLAFLRLLRESGWIPGPEQDEAVAQQTGMSLGRYPAESLPPHVRILGTLAQSVLFMPSRRMAHLLWTPYSPHLQDVDWKVFMRTDPWPNPLGSGGVVSASASSSKQRVAELNERSGLLSSAAPSSSSVSGALAAAADPNATTAGYGSGASSSNASPPQHQQASPETPTHAAQLTHVGAPSVTPTFPVVVASAFADDLPIYVCHRIVARTNTSKEDIGRFPRFKVLWVLELQCGRRTGQVRRARITGVRVRLIDDEAVMSGCCCCGAAAEWREKHEELTKKVEAVFGVHSESKGDAEDF